MVQDCREKCSDLEGRNANLAADKERLKVQLKDKESALRVVQNERDCLERDVTHYISEIKVISPTNTCSCNIAQRHVCLQHRPPRSKSRVAQCVFLVTHQHVLCDITFCHTCPCPLPWYIVAEFRQADVIVSRVIDVAQLY